MRRRIYPNATTGTGLHGAGPIVLAQRRGIEPGESDTITWDALEKLGWSFYDGPAKTDERGYVVHGSDPGRGL